MFSAIADGFGYLFGLLWKVANWILDGLYTLLKPVFEFIGAIFYFVYKLGIVLYKVLEIVVAIAKMLIGISVGLFKTIFGLSYTGSSSGAIPSSYMSAFGKMQPIFEQLQFNKLAYLLIFGIWIAAAIVAMRIIGGLRGGGVE